MRRLMIMVVFALFCVGGLVVGENCSLCNETNGYDYKDALSKAILFFEGQRSGKLPSSQRVKWRGDSALSDGKPENVGYALYHMLD